MLAEVDTKVPTVSTITSIITIIVVVDILLIYEHLFIHHEW